MDSKALDKEILTQLLHRTDISSYTRLKIKKQLSHLYSGMKGENQSAYQLGFHFGQSADWIIIHDLRLVYQHQVAQIDHLLINRFLQTFVCESKSVAGGIVINEQGEFLYQYQDKKHGTASPLQQNQRHIAILKNIFMSGLITLPKRLGINLQPRLESLILIANDTYIRRPQTRVAGIDCIIKNEQIKTKIDERINKLNVFHLCKKISSTTLEDIGQQLCSLHRPKPTKNWYKYFGIYPSDEFNIINSGMSGKLQSKNYEANQPKLATVQLCNCCGKNLSTAEEQFCHRFKNRFNGKAYCYLCQRIIESNKKVD